METPTHYSSNHHTDMLPEKTGHSVVQSVEVTPEMELNGSTLDRSRSPELGNGFSSSTSMAIHPFKRSTIRSSSPTGSVRSSSLSTSRRHLVSRRFSGGSLMRSHRSEVSKELTLQGESEFFALMELMSNISRRSNSLKDVWMKLISERESCLSEMDRMQEQFEEYTEIIESKEKEQTQHQHDHEEKKKEVSRLRLELSTVLASVNEYKKKLTDRDTDLDNTRRELHEYKEMSTRFRTEHEEMKRSLEATQLKLVSSEEERSHARKDAEKHHGDLRSLNQKHAELHTGFTQLTSKHESTHKELVSLKQAKASLTKEKHEWLHMKSELDESLRKANHRGNEFSTKIEELTKSHEKKVQEVHKLKQTVSKIEYEKDELHQSLEDLKRKADERHSKWEDAEDRCGKWKVKWEHSERESASIREEVRHFEAEKTELREALSKKVEELRLVITEKDRVNGDFHAERKKSEEHHRKITLLQETIRRHEASIKERTESIRSLHERVERLEIERDGARSKCGDLTIEIEQLRASIASLKVEITAAHEEHDVACEKLRESEARYEEACVTMSEYTEGHGNFEYEVTTLRTMLREAREQKEKAIEARNSADHERDASIARYEEKCRELERFEEQMSEQMRAQASSSSSGGSRTVRRFFSRSSTSNEMLRSSASHDMLRSSVSNDMLNGSSRHISGNIEE
ncbi:hypothetical protein PG997_008333 [Apiospora hydei]|uniref:Uncharacterized protein n=1 Tax=Apiospora hydei TaxID=1337664 RepID=A0ABR1WAI3_9PEZI